MRRAVWLMVLGLAAVLSGCGTPDLPWSVLDAKYSSAASRLAEMPDGVKVHYRDEGDASARPVILVHGFSASLHAWEPWVARLGGDYRLITLDLPGHGLTRTPPGYRASADGDVAIIDALANRLGLATFVLGGNSMGGAVAWNYALAHPQRLDGLILVDAAGPSDGPPPAARLMANPVGFWFLKRLDPRPLAERGLPGAYVDPAALTPAVIDRYVELARAPGHREVLVSRRPAPRRDPAAIATPTLVMTGEQDTLIRPAVARDLAARIPAAKLVVYPGVGHVPMEQIPDRSAADIRVFLESLAPLTRRESGSTVR